MCIFLVRLVEVVRYGWQKENFTVGLYTENSATWVFRNFSFQTSFKLRGFNTIQLAPTSSDYVYPYSLLSYLIIFQTRTYTLLASISYRGCYRLKFIIIWHLYSCTRRPLLAHIYPCWNASNRTPRMLISQKQGLGTVASSDQAPFTKSTEAKAGPAIPKIPYRIYNGARVLKICL